MVGRDGTTSSVVDGAPVVDGELRQRGVDELLFATRSFSPRKPVAAFIDLQTSSCFLEIFESFFKIYNFDSGDDLSLYLKDCCSE